MFHSHLIRRTLQIGACGAAIVLCSVPGSSEPAKAPKTDKAACKAAYKSAQASEQASRLRDAKEQYLTCSKTACGAFLRPECTTKYTQLTSDIPSVIPVVTDENGSAVTEVQVKVDGETVTSRLDGRAIEVDPGNHEFVFSTSSGVIATQKIMVVAGQRNSPIAVSTAKGGRRLAASVTIPQAASRPATEPKASPEKPSSEATAPRAPVSEKEPPAEESAMDAPPETTKSGGPGPWPWIIGGAGVAAVGTSVMLSIWGQKDNNSLSACSPNCSTDSVQHIKNLYTAADIALGVGVVALGVSTYLFATSGSSSKEKAPAKSASYMVDVQPTAGGAFATVSGAF